MSTYPEYWNRTMETAATPDFTKAQEQAFLREMDYIFANSIFYQRKFNEAGIKRDDIRSLEDLKLLPFTEKSELRDSQLTTPPFGDHRACPLQKIKRVYSTSGTTGRPTFIGLTQHDLQVWRETACRAFWTGGFRPDSMVPLVVAPFFIAASYADAIESIGTLVPIGVGATDRLINAFQNLGANAFLSTSSFPLHFAASLRQKGIDPKSLGIKIILAGGEPGAAIPAVREEVERTFGCIFLEMMGNGDMCGQIWSECRFKQGMHFVAQGAVQPEIVNPETHEVLPIREGTRGELVYTSLDRECMPLVRFLTRDHVEVTQTSCECGRTGFGIRVFGRTDDMIIVQGVNVYPAAIRDVVAALVPLTTGAIEVQLHSPPPQGWFPPVHIKVEHGPEAGHLPSLKKRIEETLRSQLIFKADVELVPPHTLPRYEYKAKLVRKLYEERT
ncbi:MAG: phenylacetate--CoA ligase family protein [Acidobacteria bacterium]|nr:phenylacetate--CoA ligase family protein [Acidobacteriota bacterium]